MAAIREVAKCVKSALEENGVGKASYTVLTKETHEFNVDGGEFSLFRTLYDNYLTVTTYKDNKKGSSGTNRFEEEAVRRLVADCVKSSESGVADEAYDIAPKQESRCFREGAFEPDIDRLFARAKELMENIGERHPKILMEQMIITHEKVHSLYQNTNGTEFETYEGSYSVSLMFSAHEGDKTTSFFGTGVVTDNLDRPFIETGSLEKDLTDVEAQLETVPTGDKFEGTLILTPASLSSFLYSILGNFVCDSVILEKTSVWLDKLGKQVADKRITLSANPHDKRIVCGERYTADGFLSEDFDIIKDGVLNSFMLSLYVSNKSGFKREGNSSMALVMPPGDTSYEDMIKNVKKGIIVGRFSGGNPGVNGEFSGVAKNSFLVEDGEIRGAVSETMISGNLADMLKRIVAVSKETVADGTSVLPYLAVDGIVISGRQK